MEWPLVEALDWIVDGRFSRETLGRKIRVGINFEYGMNELVSALKAGKLAAVGELFCGGDQAVPAPIPAAAWRNTTTDYPTGEKKLLDFLGAGDGAVLSTPNYRWINIVVSKDDVISRWPPVTGDKLAEEINAVEQSQDEVSAVAVNETHAVRRRQVPRTFLEFLVGKPKLIEIENHFVACFPDQDLPTLRRPTVMAIFQRERGIKKGAIKQRTYEEWKQLRKTWLEMMTDLDP
jgi:hypothetical protein